MLSKLIGGHIESLRCTQIYNGLINSTNPYLSRGINNNVIFLFGLFNFN